MGGVGASGGSSREMGGKEASGGSAREMGTGGGSVKETGGVGVGGGSASQGKGPPQTGRNAEERYEELFRRLDKDKDGRISVNELKEGIDAMGLPSMSGTAQAVVTMGDTDEDGLLSFREFATYCAEHEKRLWLVFQGLDINQDGVIDAEEMKTSLRKIGLCVSDDEIHELLKKMDKDGNVRISWEEWREYLLLQPHSCVHSIFKIWSHSTAINIGEVLENWVPEELYEEEKVEGGWWKQLLAGGGAGAVSRSCTAPLDRLKIFFQVSSMQGQRFTLVSCVQHMLEEGGLRSLWRGNGINVLKIAPETALRFFAYENVKKLLAGDDVEKPLQVHWRLLAGSTAGVIAQTTIYPMEVLKTRLALGTTGQYRGMADCCRQILQREGPRGLYRGLTPSLVGIIPYAGIDLAVYETIKNMYLSRHEGEDPGVLVPLACGTVSSTCGQLASYPLSLVRTRLQAQTSPLGRRAAGEGLEPAPGMLQTLRTVYREEHVRGLYRGFLPNFLKAMPAVSIGYVVYEQLKLLLNVETVR